MQNPAHKNKLSNITNIGFVLLLLVLLCVYFYRWNWHSLTDADKLECYGQICVNGRMIGSGFFLEDISGFKRAWYFVTNEHVRKDAAELSRQSGTPILIRFKSGNSDRADYLNLGTGAFCRFENTDIAVIPIYPPLLNRVIAGAGYRFVALDRDFIKGEKKALSKGRMYLVSSANYSSVGITNNAATRTYHHFPEPGNAASILNIWSNTVQQADGYVLSVPVMDRPIQEFQETPICQVITSVIPGDSGALVTHEENGVSFAFAVIEGIPYNGVAQAGPAFAISSDVVINSIPQPTINTTSQAFSRSVMVLVIFVAAFIFVKIMLLWFVNNMKKQIATQVDTNTK